ncbi:hypothetical protein LTR09_009166 [Extremus antarcticus]|uniref:Uncharacterized protein n=1 Tax=Extremus antarcticus TaxID=702011 RepID=A0AAJ0GBY3_9PEZI|nr:hypothetical protein LTR09_009166 [Extremus antarcticus]
MAPTTLLRRDDHLLNGTTSTLTIVLVVLVAVTLILVGALLFLRQRRKAQRLELPAYSEKRVSTSSTHSHHRRITARPSQSIHIYRDKEIRVSESSSAPPSPTSSVPEIRITFPEEVDASGKRQSGRVVVVHVGDTGVGLQPMDEKLPEYEQRDSGFQSVDLEKVGGLMEKETRPSSSLN